MYGGTYLVKIGNNLAEKELSSKTLFDQSVDEKI